MGAAAAHGARGLRDGCAPAPSGLMRVPVTPLALAAAVQAAMESNCEIGARRLLRFTMI